MNIDAAVKRACKEDTMLGAFAFICLWEFERARKTVKPNEPYETCFKHCLKLVKEKYEGSLYDCDYCGDTRFDPENFTSSGQLPCPSCKDISIEKNSE